MAQTSAERVAAHRARKKAQEEQVPVSTVTPDVTSIAEAQETVARLAAELRSARAQLSDLEVVERRTEAAHVAEVAEANRQRYEVRLVEPADLPPGCPLALTWAARAEADQQYTTAAARAEELHSRLAEVRRWLAEVSDVTPAAFVEKQAEETLLARQLPPAQVAAREAHERLSRADDQWQRKYGAYALAMKKTRGIYAGSVPQSDRAGYEHTIAELLQPAV